MEYKWVQGRSEGFEDAAEVRKMVFCDEQGYSVDGELDAVDGVAWHVVGYQDGAPVCTARLYGEDGKALHIGRVAVLKNCRGLGLGRAVMLHQEQKARQLGATSLVIDAQTARQIFYEKLGYVATGQTSLDEGAPHMEMEKQLSMGLSD